MKRSNKTLGAAALTAVTASVATALFFAIGQAEANRATEPPPAIETAARIEPQGPATNSDVGTDTTPLPDRTGPDSTDPDSTVADSTIPDSTVLDSTVPDSTVAVPGRNSNLRSDDNSTDGSSSDDGPGHIEDSNDSDKPHLDDDDGPDESSNDDGPGHIEDSDDDDGPGHIEDSDDDDGPGHIEDSNDDDGPDDD